VSIVAKGGWHFGHSRYVAATRAKDRLLITHAAERGRRETGGPSRFLAEAGLEQTPRELAA
jgi:DNA helicase-2/ATP-dependent DNA helicase PcrA